MSEARAESAQTFREDTGPFEDGRFQSFKPAEPELAYSLNTAQHFKDELGDDILVSGDLRGNKLCKGAPGQMAFWVNKSSSDRLHMVVSAGDKHSDVFEIPLAQLKAILEIVEQAKRDQPLVLRTK
jgi:hypothetical protein